ncbi:hypothetical protein ACQ7B2_32040, partial [Escherichia coli]
NLLCLPQGLLYGFLSPDDAVHAVAEHTGGKIFLPKLRGRVCYTKPVQAADFFVCRETGISGLDRLRFIEAVQTTPGTWRTTFAE